MRIEKSQEASGGELNITWQDRFIEVVNKGDEFSVYRHLKTGRALTLPNSVVWTDKDGNLYTCDYGTDYYLPVNAGDTVSVIKEFTGIVYAKMNGTAGWIKT
jgi:protein phosphatase